MEIVGNWGEDILIQTAPSEPSIKSNPFTNGTHILMKWNASTCDIPNYQVTYHYELSGGGIFQQRNTTETQVLFGEGIESCTEYTFTVLASFLHVSGTSDTKKFIFGPNCDQKKQGYIIGVVIGSLIAAVITVAVIVMMYKRFRRIDSGKHAAKFDVQQNVCTIDTNYQSLSKKYEESEYEEIKPAVESSSGEHVYANTKPAPEHVYVNTVD
ncbi:uncharacterized protein [Antedon mediterranea]|uniref:uncharacterized protein n=1 Tax=Antedon mediterranea TaxID=105859 RepID=UPI003AF9AD09